jgi:high-affinity iron transporter
MWTFLIPFREALEAAIIVWLILSLLKVSGAIKIGRKYIIAWIIAWVFFSILLAWIFHVFFSGFEWKVEKIYEGTLMILAFSLISQFIIWSNHNFKNIWHKAKKKISKALKTWELWILFMITFSVVVREWVETIIFLNALQVSNTSTSILIGVLWILSAMLIAWIMFLWIKKINVKKVLHYSNIMFVFIAAWLLAHGIVEFQWAELLPTFIKPVFDMSSVLSEKEWIGAFLKAVFWYDANPSLIALVAYFSYIVFMFGWLKKKN